MKKSMKVNIVFTAIFLFFGLSFFAVPDISWAGEAQGTFEGINPLETSNMPKLVGKALRALFGIIGTIALAIFIYGGALWMLSLGDEQRVTRARETMIWAGLGLLAVFGSYVVVQFVLNTLLKPPETPPTTATDTHSAFRAYDIHGRNGSIIERFRRL